MSYNNTSNEQRQAGSGLADKAASVYHLAHGAGENLRGTLLGAVDTIAKSPMGESKNDAIATKGREEMTRAMEVLRMPLSRSGHTTHSNTAAQTGRTAGHHAGPYPRTTETAGNYQSSAYADPTVYPGERRHYLLHETLVADIEICCLTGGGASMNPTAVGATDPAHGHATTFPNHHRDDAISGLPPNQAQDFQGLGQKPEHQLSYGQNNPGGAGYYGSQDQQNYGAPAGYPNEELRRPYS
ncbi:hypothetical protein BJ165DRAFT_1486613 [Panaeolus papilionaceus]|nr:hypothetical protein BJ165DRAFT_1486613 [Panaeolus papilionaceus]